MKCPNCGKEISPSDKFCMGCGVKVESGMTGAETQRYDTVSTYAGSAFNGAKNSLMGSGKNGVNFLVRRFFLGFADIMWISAIICIIFTILDFGIFFTLVRVVAGVTFIGSAALSIYSRVIGVGKTNVDEATENAVNMLRSRAKDKFNVDDEQIKEVEPIVVAGAGVTPVELVGVIPVKKNRFANFSKFYSKDPIEAYRVGNDGIPRYMLIQTTVFAFTDTQLLVYSGNVDISTGIVYDEMVSEIFYKDVNSVTQRDILKKFKAGIFRKEYYTLKYLELDVCGITQIASFDSRFVENTEASLTGMESYIREKKY